MLAVANFIFGYYLFVICLLFVCYLIRMKSEIGVTWILFLLQ